MINLMLGDCLERMKEIPDGSVDMVLTDPPYGTTACKWDSVIPFEPMWEQLKRITKDNGAIVMTASQPFTSALVMSNVKMFKYSWVWLKPPSGNLNAKIMPMAGHEDVCIFGAGKLHYKPQGLVRAPRKRRASEVSKTTAYGLQNAKNYTQEFTNFPHTRLEFNKDKGLHPTQKPVALMEYLIRTYTNAGETVLDFTMGSGTTGVAAKNLNRKFIGIEMDETYFKIAKERIEGLNPLQEFLND
jgi:site-specific DNA-methyltransferase (adenine-specific)